MRLAAVGPVALSLVALVLTGCSLTPTATPTAAPGLAISGKVHGGQQYVKGAHLYLFAANSSTSGYGQPSVSLLSAASTGASDSLGAYVTSDSTGSFTITGDYTCSPGAQVYLYSLGGDSGAGNNSAVGLLAALGSCPASGNFLAQIPFISINEVTTVAAAYALSGFATDATHVSSSNTPLALTGVANAFINAANLADVSTGTAPTTTLAGNGTVPQASIYTVANILAACINSTVTGFPSCTTLFSHALSGGSTGTTPTDTATAAINIAHHPGVSVHTLFGLQAAAGSPFQTALSTEPTDFTLTILIPTNPGRIAVDASGNLWTCSYTGLLEFSSAGALLSPAAGFSGGGAFTYCNSPTVDPSGNIWVLATNSAAQPALFEFSSAGALLSGPTGYTGNGLTQYSYSISIDGTGNVWVVNGSSNTISKFTNTGAAAAGSPFSGNGLSSPGSIAIDSTGSVWVMGAKLSKFTNAGAPAAGSPFNVSGGAITIDASDNVWFDYYGAPGGIAKLNSSGVPWVGSPFTGGGASNGAYGLAVDGSSNIWADSQLTGFGDATLVELANSGAAITPSTGYRPIGQDESNDPIAIDPSGSVWVFGALVGGGSDLAITIGAATPVVTPISTALKNQTVGTRP